jgi:HSP20 family molecular chaperone IbpA
MTASSTKKPLTIQKDWLEDEDQDGELTVDVYNSGSDIVIKTMVAGVRPEDLDISITRDSVTIKGKRESEKTITDDDYFHQELYWGTFSRTIQLPVEVEVEEAEAVEKLLQKQTLQIIVFITEDLKANSMSFDFCNKSYYLSISSFIIEKHSFPKKISCILKIIHRTEEEEITSDKRIIIFKNIHTNTIRNSYINRKVEDKSSKNVILSRFSKIVSLFHFYQNFIINGCTDNRSLVGSPHNTPLSLIL